MTGTGYRTAQLPDTGLYSTAGEIPGALSCRPPVSEAASRLGRGARRERPRAAAGRNQVGLAAAEGPQLTLGLVPARNCAANSLPGVRLGQAERPPAVRLFEAKLTTLAPAACRLPSPCEGTLSAHQPDIYSQSPLLPSSRRTYSRRSGIGPLPVRVSTYQFTAAPRRRSSSGNITSPLRIFHMIGAVASIQLRFLSPRLWRCGLRAPFCLAAGPVAA